MFSLEQKIKEAVSSSSDDESDADPPSEVDEGQFEEEEEFQTEVIRTRSAASYIPKVKESLARETCSLAVKGHSNSVDAFCLAFSPDCKLLAAGCSDGSVRIYNQQNKLAYFLRVPSVGLLPTTCMAFRPYSAQAKSKNVLLVANSDGTLSHWHVSSETCLFSIKEEDNQILSVDCSKDGNTFATAGREPVVRVYDEATKSLAVELKVGMGQNVPGHSSRIYCVKYHATDDNILLSGGWDNTIQIWDVRVGYSVRSIFGPHICGESISVHPEGKMLLTGSYRPEKPVELWDLGTGKVISSVGWTAHKDSPQMVYASSFSPDGKSLIAGGVGGGWSEARLFETSTLNAVDSVTLGDHPIYSMCFDPAGGRLAVGGGTPELVTVSL